MKTYQQLIEECLQTVKEIFPWDLEEKLEAGDEPILLDINVPRGILEQSSEWDFEETIPDLVKARDREIIVICRSGNRSVLAAYTMQQMGYENTASLKTGLKGWTDYEQPLVNNENQEVDIDDADEYFASKVKPEQERPK